MVEPWNLWYDGKKTHAGVTNNHELIIENKQHKI